MATVQRIKVDVESKSQSKLTLNREYMVAEYLTTVTDIKVRKTLTMYRLSGHSLYKTGRHRQNKLPMFTLS